MAKKPNIKISKISKLSGSDLHELCDAAEAAIEEGGGFGWLTPPPRRVLENFWRGALMVPERSLFIGRLDGVVVGSAQLVRPTKNNEAQAMAATLTTNFVAPWARGHGMARALLEHIEEEARARGFEAMNLSVRETQSAAVNLYETLGFKRWGTHPKYAQIDGNNVAGHYYCKEL